MRIVEEKTTALLAFLISTRQWSIEALIPDTRPDPATVLILLGMVWSGLVIFYFLFFYAIGKSSRDPAASEFRDSLEGFSSTDSPPEKLPEQVTIRDEVILIERPVAIIVQEPNRTETSAQGLTVHEPSLAIVEGDRLFVVEGPSSVTIEDSEAELDNLPANQFDSTALLEGAENKDYQLCLQPEAVYIKNPDSIAIE